MTEAIVLPLRNGARLLALPLPHLETASVSLFVRTGSAHERRAENGICHVVEHMVFKGTAARDARRINLDAELLGAEVNAHTDKDHTAFHMRGRDRDAATFVRMLGELLTEPTFPADELERERQVLLHEVTEDEDDALATAFKLFDKACFGDHGAAQAVIGARRTVERVGRDALADWVRAQYTAANVIVGVAGRVDAQALACVADEVLAPLAPGAPNVVAPATYGGGIASKREGGGSQAHAVLGFGLPPLVADDARGKVAAALFGEGMSSPLLHRVREQQGLAYYAACSADVLEMCGQFVVEASTGPKELPALLDAVLGLLADQAQHIDATDLQRAHQQLAVRLLRDHERPQRQLEDAALDLFALGRVRPAREQLEAIEATGAEAVRAAFEAGLAQGVTVTLAGELPRAASERAREAVRRAGLRAADGRAALQ